MFEKILVRAPYIAQAILWLMLACWLVLCMTGCITTEKAVAIASNGTVVKLESIGSPTSATVAPNILMGVVQNAIATAPALKEGEKTQVSIAYTESHSWLAAVFGVTATTRTFSYIGLPGETAEQTKVRLEALVKVLTSTAKTSPSDTGTQPSTTAALPP